MKKIIYMFAVLATAVSVLSSCLKSDSDYSVTSYDDTAITAFTMSTLNRYTTIVSATTGRDSTIKTTLSGAYYPMSIDHVGRRIFNVKPLPAGTDVKHVVATISTLNNGIVFLKSLTNDSLSFFSSADSIDYSVPRTLRVYSSSGSDTRDYTVTINVDNNTGTTFAWEKAGNVGDGAAEFSDLSLMTKADTLVLFANVGGLGWQAFASSDGADWETGLGSNATWSGNAVVKGDTLYQLLDGKLWSWSCLHDAAQPAADASNLKQLVGAGTTELFALGTDGRMKVSADNGQTWTDEQLDSDASLLPDTGLACVSFDFMPSDDTDYVLLIGTNQNNSGAANLLWRKISQYGPHADACQWIYMPFDGTNYSYMPRSQWNALAYYDGNLLAVGSDMVLRQSRDQGITWKSNSTYALPSTLTGSRVAMTTDANGHLWMVTSTGEVWKGELK